MSAHAVAVETTRVTNNEVDFAGYSGLNVEYRATGA